MKMGSCNLPGTNVTIVYFNLEFISLEQVHQEDVIKICYFLISILSSFVTIPLIYGIVWYERSHHYRTLINRLASSICVYQINWLILVHLFAICHLASGSAGSFQCTLELMLINVTAMQAMFLIISIIIFKYIFVFKLKNPLAIQEDFFYVFINLCSFVLSFLSELVFVLSPGRNPLMYHICTGKYPAKSFSLDQPVKINHPVYWLLLLTIVTHLVAGIKLKRARKLGGPDGPLVSPAPHSVSVLQSLTTRKNLADFSTNAVSIFLISVSLSSTLILNKMSVLEVTKYSNIVFIYFWQWCLPQLLAYSTILIYYRGQKQLRKEIWKAAESCLDKCPKICNANHLGPTS